MPAFRALGQVGAGFLRIKVVAADAVKRHATAFGIEPRAIPAIIVGPEKAEQTEHQQAIKDDPEREIRGRNHAAEFTRSSEGAKGK
ncbi:MAG: hypothetical protein JWQ83_1959 [Lacunisphaera sp.]|nr:hypothetical protein [Lacunisphaera sp.]